MNNDEFKSVSIESTSDLIYFSVTIIDLNDVFSSIPLFLY